MPVKVERLAFGPSASQATGSFREFVRFVNEAFAGSGFVNQFPSGTINTASVDPPAVGNQLRGYSVFAFGDSLQATQPLFVRIDFRSIQTAAINVWGLNLSLGERHDGSGTLDSLYFTSSVTIGNNTAGGAFAAQQSSSCLWTGESGSRVAVVMAAYASGTSADFPQFWFNLNRTNDWAGSLTPSGALLIFGGSSGSSPRAGHVYHSMEIGKLYAQTGGNSILLSTTSGNLPAISPFLVGRGRIEPSSFDVYAVNVLDTAYTASNTIISSSTYTLSPYGVSRTYLRLPVSIGGGGIGAGGNFLYTNTNAAMFLRFE